MHWPRHEPPPKHMHIFIVTRINHYAITITRLLALKYHNMPGFSNVRYRFYSDIDRLTAVLALHERKIAHPFDKYLLT